SKKPLSILQDIQRTLDEAGDGGTQPVKSEALPDSVSQVLLPPVNINLPVKNAEKIEARFDISVDQSEARAFFLSLVEGTPYNMVVHQDVKGRITLDLKNVTITEAMEVAHDVYGYEYERTKTGFIVRSNQLQSKIFKVDYLNVSRAGQSETRVSSGQLTKSTKSTSSTSDNSTTENQSRTTMAASQIKTESSSDFWMEIKNSIEAIIGKEGEGKSIVVSPQSGLVIVRALPSELRKVAQYLGSAEDVMQRQVILEAKIIEVELSDGYRQGINWASLSDSGKVLAGQTGGGTLLTEGVSEIGGNTGVLNPGGFTQINSTATSAFGGMFTLAVNTGNFRAFFELLETQGNLQVLSSPRVSTVNNQKAVIKVGSDEFFVTEISSTTVTGTSTATTPQITLTPFFSGIALDVTPQISENGDVILHIHPSISEVVDQKKTITVADQVQELPLAFSSVRESDSVVRAKNGQIIVIGGLMKNKLVQKETATPFLSEIPFLGYLFKHTSDVQVKSELVILLRPIVVDTDDDWSMSIRGSSDQVKQIYHDYDK
ncbi:MAG TPA: pilus (MSHA type) biogenesis protein MshL, partial [Gammaproteobacteria bacterium]|nr:pilus (MSHA type) biogenesis protein MshL [Gammaproteobacteria bacterium]